jgi:putative Mn2+ efflux pump MntP
VPIVAAVLLALALAADAAAAAAARGLAVPHVSARDTARLALLFGGFQGGMAAIGWQVGARAGAWFAAWDHWVAFVVLVAIGIKMLHEAIAGGDDVVVPTFAWRPLLILAVATSIDALAAGVTLELVGPPPWLTLALIAGITAALSVAGLHLGRRAGALLGRRVELAGGLILIGLGIKVLVEHLSA